MPQAHSNYDGPGRYMHYKGNQYQVLGLAVRESSFGLLEEKLDVIYVPIDNAGLESHDAMFWSRPIEDFNAFVTTGTGDLTQRFWKMRSE